MGRGDRRTKKGKIFKGTFGKSRPKNKNSNAVVKAKQKQKTAGPKK